MHSTMCHPLPARGAPLPGNTALAVAAAVLCQGVAIAQTLQDVVVSGSRTEQRSFDTTLRSKI